MLNIVNEANIEYFIHKLDKNHINYKRYGYFFKLDLMLIIFKVSKWKFMMNKIIVYTYDIKSTINFVLKYCKTFEIYKLLLQMGLCNDISKEIIYCLL